ncbi:MAG: AIR synthase-related protein, partial [Anaerolineae bacterium]|nr:AIR synthase-related protein [Anaerolineae bacterium]
DLPATVPPGLPNKPLATARALHQAIAAGLVRACHDLSEGGLAVAAAEMALAGGLGLEIDPATLPVAADVDHPLITLFSESNGRWLVEVTPEQAGEFERTMKDSPVTRCGRVTAELKLIVGPIAADVGELNRIWRGEQS